MTRPEDHPDYDFAAMRWGSTLYWQPWAKKRPRISAAVKGHKRRTHQDPEDAAAEKATRMALVARDLPMLTSNVELSLAFYRASRQVVDMDNLEKHFLDAANGVLWVDDCQVTLKHALLACDPNQPRTEFWYGRTTSSMLRDRSGEPYDKAQAQLAIWRTEITG